jgi:hypothetical protein
MIFFLFLFIFDVVVIIGLASDFKRINATAKQSAFFGEGTGQIWMDELRCGDTDTDLFRCPQNGLGSHNCAHGEDAGVVCQTNGNILRLCQ